jgi:hypothetical protein
MARCAPTSRAPPVEALMSTDVPSADQNFESLRQHRAELRESIGALEQALAAPARDRTDRWFERVQVALIELTADFREHIDITEGPEGLYPGVLSSAPHLCSSVATLTREHIQIKDMADQLLALLSEQAATADVDSARELGNALLGKLIRHRQRGADLVYEAYQTDIGGEN